MWPFAPNFLKRRQSRKKGKLIGGQTLQGWVETGLFLHWNTQQLCLPHLQRQWLFELNVKRHYQTCHADIYDKITGKEGSEKLKQLEASLISQQQYFARARVSNQNATNASYEVAALIAKHCKPFTEGEIWLWWGKSHLRSSKSFPKSAWHVTLWHTGLKKCHQASKDN